MPAKLIDITGKRFGRIEVVRRGFDEAKKEFRWFCKCDCGKEFFADGTSIRRGLYTSCGCRQRMTRLSHGRHRDPVYRIWRNMIARCCFPNSEAYPNYGGRGIKVCDRWRESIEAFAADMGPRPDGMTLERIDNAGNYEPGNCRWATPLEQGNNKRNNVTAMMDGKTKTVAEWCRELGLNYATMAKRIECYGFTPEDALVRPVRSHRRKAVASP